MKILATPEAVKTLWRMQVSIFVNTINLSMPIEGSLIPHDLTKYSLIKPSECIPYANVYTLYDLKMVLWSHKRVHGLD